MMTPGPKLHGLKGAAPFLHASFPRFRIILELENAPLRLAAGRTVSNRRPGASVVSEWYT